MKRSFFVSALTAGLVAGTLDITAACIQVYLKNGTTPAKVLRYVASGVFGKEATSGGTTMALWGLLFHFIIAISFTFFFFFLAKQIPSLVKYPIPIAIVYGVFVWAFMRYITIPYLSQIPSRPFVLKDQAIAATILVVCIGLPDALLAKRYFKTKYLIS